MKSKETKKDRDEEILYYMGAFIGFLGGAGIGFMTCYFFYWGLIEYEYNNNINLGWYRGR